MMRFRSRRRLLAFALIEVMAATAIMSSLQSQGGAYRYAVTMANELNGVNNLRQVHMLLQIEGRLPKAAFYPKGNPKKDPKSIVRLIKGAPPQLFISPFAPEALKKKGLTYAWNDTVHRKDPSRLPRKTWLLIDLPAFIADPKIPKPTRYLVLYADGTAAAIDRPPSDIVKAVKAAQAKVKAKAGGQRKGSPAK